MNISHPYWTGIRSVILLWFNYISQCVFLLHSYFSFSNICQMFSRNMIIVHPFLQLRIFHKKNLICVNSVKSILPTYQDMIIVYVNFVNWCHILKCSKNVYEGEELWTSIWRENGRCQKAQPQIQIIFVLWDVLNVYFVSEEFIFCLTLKVCSGWFAFTRSPIKVTLKNGLEIKNFVHKLKTK